jgi:hypothetical protein
MTDFIGEDGREKISRYIRESARAEALMRVVLFEQNDHPANMRAVIKEAHDILAAARELLMEKQK